MTDKGLSHIGARLTALQELLLDDVGITGTGLLAHVASRLALLTRLTYQNCEGYADALDEEPEWYAGLEARLPRCQLYDDAGY